MIKDRKVTKIYIGDIFGKLDNEITKITTKIKYDKNKVKSFIHNNGKVATTYVYKLYESLYDDKIVTNVAFFMITGRTHQIRVHMKYIGKPIICDNLYGIKNPKYKEISKQYSKLALKSLSYIFHFDDINIGYIQ